MRTRLSILIIPIILLSTLSLVSAHDILVIVNDLEISNNKVIFHNDGSLVQGLGDNYASHLKQNLVVKNKGSPCLLGDITYETDPLDGFDMPIICEEDITDLSVEDTTLSKDALPVNKVYDVYINGEMKQFVGEKILQFEVNQKTDSYFQTFLKYLRLGVEHILTGFDHIVFIIGFILIAASFLSLLKSITGFTLSHSFTLTLAALGILVLSPKIVEPIIALSIVVVGLMGLFKWKDKWFSSFWLIFSFGLFHGLGFAGAIAEIGFPKTGFVLALLGFNIGVELGQLSVILIVYPLISLASKSKKYKKIIRRVLSLAVVLAGSYWLITRLF